jgi:preprotein translocase subunit SecB
MSVKKRPAIRPDVDSYADFIGSITLIGLALSNCSASVDRGSYFELSRKNTTRTVSTEYKLDDVDGECFDVSARFALTVEGKMKSPKALSLECVFIAHFHYTAPDIRRDFAERFTQSELRIILWPYFREFVSDISSKMAIPSILIPLAARNE